MDEHKENPTIADVYTLVLEVQRDMKKVKQDINDINFKMDSMNERVGEMETRLARLEDNDTESERKLSEMSTRVTDNNTAIISMTSKVNDMDSTLSDFSKLPKADYDPERTIVVTGLPDDGSLAVNQAKHLLVHGLGDHVEIVRALRIPSHSDKPGLLKIEVPGRDDKIRIHRKKSNLMVKDPYQKTFIRSSLPHT